VRRGLTVKFNGPQSETSFAQQSQMMEDLIRERVDGVVLAPSHGGVLASAVLHAKAERIPVVLVDSPVNVKESEYEAFIGSDPVKMGAMAAEKMGQLLEGRGEVAVIGVSPTVEGAVARERSFAQTLAGRFPALKIVEVRYGLSDTARAREMANEVLGTRPEVRGIFASDQGATRGALVAKRGHAGRPLALVGIAQENDLLDFMRQGELDALVVQDTFAMGQRAVEILGQAFQGEYRGPKRIVTTMALATRENLETDEIRALVGGGRQGRGETRK